MKKSYVSPQQEMAAVEAAIREENRRSWALIAEQQERRAAALAADEAEIAKAPYGVDTQLRANAFFVLEQLAASDPAIKPSAMRLSIVFPPVPVA